uniref:MULE transposase domain-containing protein n=1 Tax=Trichuris muris TaxID=70415 RepID=A0A5S6R1K1_TRIMR
MIVSLAFVPTTDLNEAIDVLGTVLLRELLPTLYWFEQNYVTAWNRFHSRRAPPFPRSMWSTYEGTLMGIDRTNNFAEAANRRIRSEFGVDHPTLWRFIDGLRKVQAGRDKEYEEYVSGQQPQHKRQKYVRVDNNIRATVRGYDRGNMVEYLQGIEHNFKMDESTHSTSLRATASSHQSVAFRPSSEFVGLKTVNSNSKELG